MAGYNAVGTGLNLAGGVASLALTQRRTGQEKMMGRIARGEQDPALAALRRTLAAQNARSAMALAASQPGLSPAQAGRQAQMGLAEANAASAGQVAGAGVELVGQARASDQSRRRRDALGMGVGQLLSQTGGALATMGAAQDAQNQDQVGDPAAAISGSLVAQAPQGTTFPQGQLPAGTEAAQASLASAVRPGPAFQENTQPMWNPTTGQAVGPTSGTMLASPYVTPPAAPLQVQANTSPMWDPTTGQQVQPGSGYALAAPGGTPAPAPAPIPAPVAPPNPVPVPVPPGGSPQGQLQMASGQGSGVGGLGQPAQGPRPQATAPASRESPEERPIASVPAPAAPAPAAAQPPPTTSPIDSLPEQVRTNPQNAGLMQMYDEYMRAGKQREARAVLAMLQSFGSA